MNYEKLLKNARKKLPKKALSDSRLEIPKADILIVGNKTILKNMSAILKTIKRDEQFFMKYIAKEAATPVQKERDSLILNRKIPPFALQQIIDKFIQRFVKCPMCGKLDTHFSEVNGIRVLKCQACGATSPVKEI